MATGLAYDLEDLERTAKDHLPTVAAVYDNAINMTESAKTALDSIPDVPEEFRGGGASISQAYAQLHGAVTSVLNSTKVNLSETAEVLHQAVKLYAQQDQAIKDKLNQLLAEDNLKPELHNEQRKSHAEGE